MSDLYCILDVSYLAYRAFFSMPKGLEFGSIPTTVAYGVFQTIESLQRDWGVSTSRFLFAFDHGPFHRQRIYPEYKGNRHETEEARKTRDAVKGQIKRIRRMLPAAGFTNCFSSKGYEADDVIAKTCQLLKDQRLMMVSSDKDLYQLLDTDRHFIWSPSKQETYTEKKFRAETGLDPQQWVKVKALAGCSSDNIPGVKSIGEKTAIEFLRTGTLTDSRREAFRKARKDGSLRLWKSLVSLPFDDQLSFEIGENEVTKKRLRAMFAELGIQSIRIDA
jgi:DNA polymerase-1